MISEELSRTILDLCNRGGAVSGPSEGGSLPSPGDPALTPLDASLTLTLRCDEVRERLAGLLSPEKADRLVAGYPRGVEKESVTLRFADLTATGRELFPLWAQGILAGGSATSYADRTRNRALSEELFRFYSDRFEAVAPAVSGRPKGIVPAFYREDGSPGLSFLEMKLASWLGSGPLPPGDSGTGSPSPIFLMTSSGTDADISEACRSYIRKGFIAERFSGAGIKPFVPDTSVQPMIAALTPAGKGLPHRIFTGNTGSPDGRLPLPGGHGQCFAVWKEHFARLEQAGYRFVSIGNVDNLGYTYHPAGTAFLALTGAEAAFDFSRKTPVDVKGGILSRNSCGRLVTLEIGSGIPAEAVFEGEKAGQPVLFNCATGLFDLQALNRNLDRIIGNLPVRLSEQNKDLGRYAQAEQNTWDVMGLLDSVKIFMVDKYDRFLAAKLLLETFLTSGLDAGDSRFPEEFSPLSESLASGLRNKTARFYSDRE